MPRLPTYLLTDAAPGKEKRPAVAGRQVDPDIFRKGQSRLDADELKGKLAGQLELKAHFHIIIHKQRAVILLHRVDL